MSATTICHYTTGITMLGYPLFLLRQQEQMQKSPKTYWLLTASVFTATMWIYPALYLQDASVNGGTRFFIAQMITQWAMKIAQITTLKEKYFSTRNITKPWQIIVDCLIPAQFVFGYDDNNNTRTKSMYPLLEVLFNSCIIGAASRVKKTEYGAAIKAVMSALQFGSVICIAGNVLALAASLILGNHIKSVEYAYQFPLKSANLQSFWKRWSTHFGTCLKECVYIPCGGKYNYISAMTATGIVCGGQHMIVNYMVSGDLKVKQQATTFGICYGATIIDGLLSRHKSDNGILMQLTRFSLMIGSFYAMIVVSPPPPA